MKIYSPNIARAIACLALVACAHCGSSPSDDPDPTSSYGSRTRRDAPPRVVARSPEPNPPQSAVPSPRVRPKPQGTESAAAEDHSPWQGRADSGRSPAQNETSVRAYPSHDAFDNEATWAPGAGRAEPSVAQRPSPDALTTIAQDRWALYCDMAAQPSHYATDTEITALALALGRNIRVVATWPNAYGTTFTVSDFSGTLVGQADDETLNVLLRREHYEPLIAGTDGAPLPSQQELQREMASAQQSALAAKLEAAARPVPGDGSCFFHSIAALTGETAEHLRDQAVAFMREHGETLRIPSRSAWMGDRTLSESYMPDARSEAYRILMEVYPD